MNHSINAIAKLRVTQSTSMFRNGGTVTLRVAQVLPGNRYRIQWNGRSFIASSSMIFKKDAVIKVQVSRNSSHLELHIVPERKQNDISRGFELGHADKLSLATLRAGLALPDGSETKRRSALLARSQGSVLRLSRLYAELISKGLDPTAELLEFVDNFFSNNQKRQRHKALQWNTDKSKLFLQSGVKNQSSVEYDLIDLINLYQGKNGHWTFHNLVIRIGQKDFSTIWKIRTSRINSALALTVYDDQRVLEFLLEGEPVRLEVFASSNHGISETKWRKFRERIALHQNVIVGEEIRSIEQSDSFSVA